MADQSSPPSLRIIRRTKAWLGRHRRGVISGLVLLGLTQGIYTVANGESALILRWGRRTGSYIDSGLSYRLPGGIDQVLRVRTGDVFRLEVRGDRGPALEVLTGDENLVETALVVQYRIGDLGDFLLASENPEELIRQTVRAALVEAVAATAVEDVLTSAKAAIQNQVREQAGDLLESLGTGVILVAVNLQSVSPPAEAAAAFRKVNDARAEAGQAISEAGGRAERLVRVAVGEAGQIDQQAAATAAVRVMQANGAADRFNELLRQSQSSPQQVRDELYFDAIQRILPRARVLLVPPSGEPRIDLNLLPRSESDQPPPLPDFLKQRQ